jgi:hypothetical protein
MIATSAKTEVINMKLIIVGLLIFLGMIFFIDIQPDKPEIKYTAAIVVLMAFL